VSIFGCKHENAAFPQKGFQRCVDCGARREYEIGKDPREWILEPETPEDLKSKGRIKS
jgi:hypothetical protein